MTDSTQSRVWIELARQLVARRDVRPEVRTALERALASGEPDAIASAVRQAMARAIAGQQRERVEADDARLEAESRRQRDLARARQSRALIEHGLSRLAAGDEVVSKRLCGFLRDQLQGYASAVVQAGAPADLEAPQIVAERVLNAVAEHRVMARPVRVGILTPSESAALAAGSLRPRMAATVRSSGDVDRDLAAWEASSAVDEARKQALAEGRFEDGDYLFAIIEPTADGRRLVIHPITADGSTSAEPVETFDLPPSEEPVAAVQMIVEPAVRDDVERTPLMPPTTVGQRADVVPSELPGLRRVAAALNQTRINLYASILESRPDLAPKARRQAERQLERMQRESEAVAADLQPTRITAFLSKWNQELTRDMRQLFGASPGSEQSLDALSRLGALRHRIASAQASIDGVERRRRPMRAAGREDLVFASPAVEPLSVFDGLSGASIAPLARQAASKPVAGESLLSDVVARDAMRSAKPSQQTRQMVQAIKAGGQRLRQAMTTMSTVHSSGLALSSQLRPLLRADMPSDIRPDLRSPLMRQVLLPALERVSGKGRAMARVAQPKASSPALAPEALYAMMLGQTGLELAQARPEIASDVLAQLAGLAGGSEAGVGATAGALMKAGEQVIDRVTAIAAMGTESGAESGAAADQMGGSQVAAELAADGGGGARSALIDDAAGALQQEGAGISSALMEKVEPFLPSKVPYAQRVFQGKMSDLVLSKMGAAGATVGDDVYLRSDLSGSEKAAVAAHELTHVTQAKGGSVESLEGQAYAVERKVHDFLSGVELAKDADVAAKADDAPEEKKDEAEQEIPLEEIADIIQRWRREAAEYAKILS